MRNLIRVFVVFAASTVGFAGSKISPDMPTSTANGLVDVIIQFNGTPSKDLMKQLGPYGQIKKQFKSVNAINISLSLATIQSLQNNSSVKYISPNRAMKGSLDITTQTVNANLAWASGWDGTGVGVAVIDSGVASKADLMAKDGINSRIVYSQSFVPGLDASDQYGHGTHVAGIIGANGSASTGLGFTRTLKGVAPNANLINLRVLDANGAASEDAVISAIDQAIALKNTYNIRVINLSLGHPIYESYMLDPMCQAVESAWQAGIVVVVAAGNYGRDNSLNTLGYGTIASPGNDPYAITVGAMNSHGTPYRTDDTIASYSSKGPTLIDHIVKPDLVAPGNGVVSLLASPTCTLAGVSGTLIPQSYYQAGAVGTSSDYFSLSGTSMATPVVSGAVALMLQKDPSLTPDLVKARLMKTAWKAVPLYSSARDLKKGLIYNNQSDIFAVGAGELDVYAALNNADFTNLPAVSLTVRYDTSGKHVYLVNTTTTVWNSAIVWGEAIVWGDNVLVSGTAIVWGEAIVWGDSSVSGFAIVWGDSPYLSDAIVAASDDDGDQ